MKLLLLTAAVLVHAAAGVPAPVPPTMTVAYKSGFDPHCGTPFKCVKTKVIKTPKPEAGEVLVAVASSSVNPCDVDYLEFGLGCSGGGGVLGMDVAGTVIAVGAGCKRLKVGDKVWADTGSAKGDSGGMAQFSVLTEAQTGIAPTTLNLTEAGTIPLAGLTALEMWQKVAEASPGGAIPPNLTMVVTAGTGGTGFIGLQLGKKVYLARTLITSTSGAADIALAKLWGADVVVDYKVQDDVFAKLADNSVDVVFDNYGEKGVSDKAQRVLKPGGIYIILPGGGGGSISKKPKKGVKQINFGYTSSSSHEPLDELAAHFNQGRVVAHIFQQVPLSNAAEAFVLSKSGDVCGKVAVVPDALL